MPSYTGQEQAVELEDVITRQFDDRTVTKLHTDSVYVTSPLRRAISTLLLTFHKRFKYLDKHNKLPRVKVWTCLQEISRNIDTQSLTPKGLTPEPHFSMVDNHSETAEM